MGSLRSSGGFSFSGELIGLPVNSLVPTSLMGLGQAYQKKKNATQS